MTLSGFLKTAALSIATLVFHIGETSAQQMKPSDDKLCFVASKQGILSGRMNQETGDLHLSGPGIEVMNPGFLAVHPNKKFLYSVNTTKIDGKNVGVATAFSIAPKTGKLTFINHQTTQGTGPTHLVVDEKGKNVLVANYGSGSVVVFPVQKNGSLNSAVSFVQHDGSSIHPSRQTGPHAHSITTDPKNVFAVSCDLGLDKVLVYKFDSKKGSLTPNDPPFGLLKPGAGPRHHAFHTSGKFLYVINELDSTMTGFRFDQKRGALHQSQTISTLPPNVTGTNFPSEVAVHPSGKFLYGSNRGHDSIVAFKIDQRNGDISAIEYEPTQGKFPRHFEIDPTGQFLFVANQDSDNVVAFRIDQKTGELTPTGNIVQAEKPQCVKFVP